VIGACIANRFYFVNCQSYIAQTRLGLALEVSEWDEADTGGEVGLVVQAPQAKFWGVNNFRIHRQEIANLQTQVVAVCGPRLIRSNQTNEAWLPGQGMKAAKRKKRPRHRNSKARCKNFSKMLEQQRSE
jgi:hypothetical protein